MLANLQTKTNPWFLYFRSHLLETISITYFNDSGKCFQTAEVLEKGVS